MLARTWRCRVRPERAIEYERFARDVSLPMFLTQPGFCGCLMTREGEACEVVTLWEDHASIVQLEASPAYRHTVEALRATGVLAEALGAHVADVHAAWLAADPEVG